MTTNDATFRFTQEGNISVLQLLPELNNVQWGEIDAIGTEVLQSLESQSNTNLIVDLSPLSYMGSAMVALIVRIWKATQSGSGGLCVICPHAGVREVLKLAALDKVWSIVDDMAEARSALGLRKLSGGSSSGSSGSSGSGAGIWIVGIILILACGALVAFALKPELFGIEKKAAPEKEEKVPAGQTEPEEKSSETNSEEKETSEKPDMNQETPSKPEPAKESKEESPSSEEEGKEEKKSESKSEKKPETKSEESSKKPAPEKSSEPEGTSESKEKPEAKPKTKPEPSPEKKS